MSTPRNSSYETIRRFFCKGMDNVAKDNGPEAKQRTRCASLIAVGKGYLDTVQSTFPSEAMGLILEI